MQNGATICARHGRDAVEVWQGARLVHRQTVT
jgi:hypothetical protein